MGNRTLLKQNLSYLYGVGFLAITDWLPYWPYNGHCCSCCKPRRRWMELCDPCWCKGAMSHPLGCYFV